MGLSGCRRIGVLVDGVDGVDLVDLVDGVDGDERVMFPALSAIPVWPT